MIKTTLFGKLKEEEITDYDLTLEYYMVTEPLCKEYSDLLRYGVKIKMIQVFPDGKTDEKSKEIRDIFYRKNDAEEFISLLIRNKVTPTHFREVVEDYISEKLKVYEN